jgi:hypothetical protein
MFRTNFSSGSINSSAEGPYNNCQGALDQLLRCLPLNPENVGSSSTQAITRFPDVLL